jgi:hypothetical protein
MTHPTQHRYSQFQENDQFGIYDAVSGKTIIPAVYDFASPEIYNDKLILVTKNGKTGFVDFNNRIVIPITYDNAREFKDGLAPVRINDSWGYVNRKNEIKIQPNPDWKWVTLFEGDIAIVRIHDDDHFYIDRTGCYLNKEPFSAAGFFEDGYAIAANKIPPNPFNNELQIINSVYQFVTAEKFNQIKYLGNKKFQVVKRIDDRGRIKTGTLRIGHEIVWDSETNKQNIWLDKIDVHKYKRKFLFL